MALSSTLLKLWIAAALFSALSASCSDSDASGPAPDAGNDGSPAAEPDATSDPDAADRTPPPGGRAPEVGISVVALALPNQEPTESTIPRIEASGGAAACDDDAGVDACDGNTAPVLGKPLYEIDGMIYDELPAGIDARAEILILVPYEDAECNLACGTYSQSFRFTGTGSVAAGGAGAAGGTPLPGDLPCGTEASGTYLGLYAPGGDGFPGTYDYHLGLSDACGEPATGETVAGTFEVQ